MNDDSKFVSSLHNLYQGRRCFVIGNGPSLTGKDLDMLENEITFASNRIYDIFPYTKWRPTFYMCVDKNIINEMQIKKPDLSGLAQSVVLCLNKRFVDSKRKELNIHEIILDGKYLPKRNQMIIDSVSENVSDYFTNTQSVTCSLIELAFYLGIKEIYLLGMDHSFGLEVDLQGNKVINKDVIPHFKEQVDRSVYPSAKEALTKCYEFLKKYADEHNVIIKNVTRGGKLEVFERDSLENILAQ